jgi:ferric-dicitrate binding protein FerR (iron transport regulator)
MIVLLAAGIAFALAGATIARLRTTSRIVVTTAFGEHKTFPLPDGSSVVLNGNSRLEFPRSWRANDVRHVRLRGEGYFNVRHTTAGTPFVVDTDRGVHVGVLGTRFDLVARPRTTRLVLIEGAVRLDVGDRVPMLVQPGQLIEVDSALDHVESRNVDAERYAEWRSDFLVLDDVSLGELAATLRESDGLELLVADSAIAAARVSGIAPVGDREGLLRGIAAITRLHVVRQGRDTILLTRATLP